MLDPTLLTRVANAASEVAASPSNCVPSSTILLSVANAHHRELRQLQWHRVRDVRCLLVRTLSVCSGFADDTYGRCVGTSYTYRPSDFRKNDYFDLIWLKWQLLAAVLGACSSALWVDADVLLLRNPFAGLPPTSDVVLAYQSETLHCTAACNLMCPMNTGVMLASNATLVQEVLQARRGDSRPTQPLDQQSAETVLRRRRWRGRVCGLSSSLYVGQCQPRKEWYRNGAPSLNRATNFTEPTSDKTRSLLCHAHTFHTCGMPTESTKRQVMRSTLDDMVACPVHTAAVRERHRAWRAH